MHQRENLLHALNTTVTQLLDVYINMDDSDVMVYESWSAKDVLAHLTFWHESFSRNVLDLVNGRKPTVLKGRLIDLNQGGVDEMRTESLETVVDRFVRSHQVIQENILNPGLVMIPYRRGSREYTPEEHLSVVDEHINHHLRDVQKVTGR
jgi:hypothetical protein